MNSRVHFPGRPIAIALVSLASIVLVACQQSKQATLRSLADTTAEKVFVVFEGPWAMVADPNDANSVLVLAPKTPIHNELYVAASNDSLLPSGRYDLSVPAHGPAASGTLDPSFAQVNIPAASLQHALNDSSGRYVIRLPKPEAYVADKRFVSRVGSSYPPDASTERNYAVFVSLQYSVSSLNGFSLAGTPDSGTFNPLLLQLETPVIRFAIEPATLDDFTDHCHTHSRTAFRDAVKYLGLTMFVDFPSDPASCHNTDPQIPHSASAGLLGSEAFKVRTTLRNTTLALMVELYFFHATDGSCKAPILFLTAS
jgi:hypothetical protein